MPGGGTIQVDITLDSRRTTNFKSEVAVLEYRYIVILEKNDK